MEWILLLVVVGAIFFFIKKKNPDEVQKVEYRAIDNATEAMKHSL